MPVGNAQLEHKRPAAAGASQPKKRREMLALRGLNGADDIEAEVGDRYRQDCSNLGLGLTWPSMQRTLRDWCSSASPTGINDGLKC